MKVGQIVQIFRDPVNELGPEGEAKLLARQDHKYGYWQGRRLEYWQVIFVGDPDNETYYRFILNPEQETVA